MGLSAIALGGLEKAYDRFGNAAATVVNAAALSAADVDMVDLSAAAVQMLAARNEFEANIATLKVADEMQRHTVDMLA